MHRNCLNLVISKANNIIREKSDNETNKMMFIEIEEGDEGRSYGKNWNPRVEHVHDGDRKEKCIICRRLNILCESHDSRFCRNSFWGHLDSTI